MELTCKVALVTGAARRLGRAIALELARAGANIMLHYHRSSEEATRTRDEIIALGRQAELFQADLADPRQIERLVIAVGKSFGRLDVLVNNAALYDRTPIETLTAEQWDAELAVNARAPALCIRHAIGLMPAGGAIINIADAAAPRGQADFAAYCASKGALLALTRSAARALGARNIRVNSVSPGLAMWHEDASEAEKAWVLEQIPMKRIGSPADIAAAALFLVGNDYVTGQDIRVDGGWCMG
jgi:NAD(P)-dependent dehydrogenase (short-subunit alcohol dehydrogenase family)